MTDKTYRALRVTEDSNGTFSRQVTDCKLSDLPNHDVLIRVHYSSLNYKDALSASGHKGITREYPHTPGVDAAGVVEASKSSRFQPGAEVLVTGHDLGMNTSGGFGQYIRVPEDWVVPKPEAFTLKESMTLGTGGFTAGLALYLMERNGQRPSMGPLVVTGASGGVGSLAVAIFSKAGYEVIAASGKADAKDYLTKLGASKIIGRDEVNDSSGKPLLSKAWAGGLDNVGDNTLSTLIRSCDYHGNIATCGNVVSPKLEATVFPFILRGVHLLGVASASTPMPQRLRIWEKLSNEWKIDQLDMIGQTCTIEELPGKIDLILDGKLQGRTVVDLGK